MIQVALGDNQYARALRDQLARISECEVRLVDRPDYQLHGVLVLDVEHMEAEQGAIDHPERIVLIAKNDPVLLSRAWDAGINSVVFDKDPLSTAVLAIMAAKLKTVTACDSHLGPTAFAARSAARPSSQRRSRGNSSPK